MYNTTVLVFKDSHPSLDLIVFLVTLLASILRNDMQLLTCIIKYLIINYVA